MIAGLSHLGQAAQSLTGLVDSVEISTGRGQSEIWALFRRDSDGHTDEDLRKAVLRVRDPSKLCAVSLFTTLTA